MFNEYYFISRFIVESVLNLRSNLKLAGSNLLIEFGKPEEVVKNIVDKLLAEDNIVSGFYYAREFTHQEIKVETSIAEAIKIPMFKYYTSTLVLPNDLPFSIDRLPDVYSNFRTKIEKVREDIAKDPIQTVTKMKPFPNLEFANTIITDEEIMQRMKITSIERDSRSAFPFKGGETAGLARVKDYYWGTKAVQTYKTTRNGLIGDQYSTKFSPWLSNGCISPRTVISLLTKFEQEHGASKDTYWVWFELLYVIAMHITYNLDGESTLNSLH